MSFRFALDEEVDRGFRRMAVEQVARAEAKLLRDGADPKAVHEVRKHLKRVRALLRLVRSGLGDRVFRAENHRFRDIGRMLAGARERHVMMQTLATLEVRDGLDTAIAAEVRACLTVEDAAVETVPLHADRIADAVRDLGVGARAIRRLRLEPAGFQVIAAGLETGVRSLHKTFRHAYADGSDEAFHEWRKAVQHHWRHMTLVGPAWPALMAARARQARELSQLIGEDHDLGVLAQFAGQAGLDRRAARAVAKACRTRQTALRRHAEPLGGRLIAESAEGFARRVTLYWDFARRAERSALADAEDDAHVDTETEALSVPRAKRNGRAGRVSTA